MITIEFKHTGIRNYFISEYGDILNKDNGIILKPFVTKDNHLRIELKIAPNKPKKFFVHRLVYQAFIGELQRGFVIEHLDGNPLNNHYSNLKQSTQKENIHTAIKHKTFGSNNANYIIVKCKSSGDILKFDKIKDLIEYTGISIPNGALSKLKKHSKFKNNYEILEVKTKRSTDYRNNNTRLSLCK